jgi:cytochrome b involved in lipid metabolism
MNEQRDIEPSELAKHKTTTSCWIAIHGTVYDVTPFLYEHPGGDDILVEHAGKDASKEFDSIGHSSVAKKMLMKYAVGKLVTTKK